MWSAYKSNPVDIVRKLNVQKTFCRRPGRLLNVLCTFNLRPVSTGKSIYKVGNEDIKKVWETWSKLKTQQNVFKFLPGTKSCYRYKRS